MSEFLYLLRKDYDCVIISASASKASVICLRMLNAMHWNKYPLLLDCHKNLAIDFMSLHLQYPKYFVVRLILMKLIEIGFLFIYLTRKSLKTCVDRCFLSCRTTFFNLPILLFAAQVLLFALW